MSLPPIRPGQLRHQIRIERPEHTTDDHGESVETFSCLKITRAYVRPISAREFISGEQITQDSTHQITMRYHHLHLTPSDRIVYKERIFNISEVVNLDERNWRIDVLAKEDLNA